MIDLTQHTTITSNQDSNFNIDSKLVAIHGIDITSTNNIKDTLSVAITTSTQTTITLSSNPLIDWTGYVGFITIEDEILYVTSATTHSATVLRGQYGTVATTHLNTSYVYTITIFKNVMSYNWSQSIGVSDRDLFSIDVENGRIVLDDIASKWNRLASNCEYAFKRNKEIFIWEGCNGQITKVWEGLTKDKNDSSENNEIIIETAGYFNKFADEPIKPVKIYDDIRPKELLESLFVGYTAKYVGNTDANDYFKIYNLSTTDFATHRDFINYICKEYAIRLLFRKDKTIHIISDMYVTKLTPIDTIQTEVTKINNDSSGNIIINTVTGTYKERAPLKNPDYTPVRFRHYREFNAPITPIPLLLSGLFQEITLTGLSYADINTMTYQEFLMIEENTVPNSRRFMCQLTDIIKIAEGNYTVKILAGYDKIKNWNERGRTSLQGNTSISNTFRLYWSFDEFPIIWKYGRNIDDEDITSNLMFPLYPNEDYTFYINSFGVGDRTDSKFSGIVKGFESLLTTPLTPHTNTQLKYNDEYAQNALPIYLYTNKIASTLTVDGRNIADDIICINSIDNSNVELQINYSDIKDNLYKLTLKNTLSVGTTNNITPISTLAGQRLIELSLTDYNLCNVGDGLKLQAVAQGEDKYSTYSSYKEARYLITSKFEDGGKYYIYLNDYYPLAETTEFTFVRYDRSTMILLNELYFRSNPVMESEISYDFTHDESIEEFGTREYTIEGKSIVKDDFLKITAYLKDSYNGFDIDGVRNKLRVDMMRRVDLEAGDCINITDSVYTQYDAQKVILTKKEVSVGTNGERDESYEMITVGDYSINPDVLLNKQIISWEPDVDPKYNNNGTEGTTKQDQDKQIDNKRLVLQDDVEGQIYAEELPYATFSALTVVTTPILSTTTVFELGLRNLTNNEYRQSLLPIDTPLIIKINSEYLSCKSLGYDDGANTASLQIIKRQVGNSTKGDISSNLSVQFFKILGKLSPQGLTSTDVSIKTGDNNYIEVHAETGVEIKSNKVVDISNTNNELHFSNVDNSYIRLDKNGTGGEFSVGQYGSSNYLKYTTATGVEIKSNKKFDISNTNNAIYFDDTSSGVNSYLKLNKSTNYYSQQIGKVTEKSSGTEKTYNGFFFGNPEAGSKNYLKYFAQGVLFEGRYFNKVAYCSSALEFIGALDTSFATVGFNGIPFINPFHNLSVNKIVLLNNIDISGLYIYHFSNSISNYLIPASDIDEISSIMGTATTLTMDDFGFKLDYQIKINNIKLINCGSIFSISSKNYGIYMNSNDIHLDNVKFYNIKGIIGTTTGRIHQSFRNIIIESYDAGIPYLFLSCANMYNITIYVNSSFTNPSTSYFFYLCNKIDNVWAKTLDSSLYYDVQWFYLSYHITNVFLQFLNCRKLFLECDSINNFYVGLSSAISSNTEFLFDTSKVMSNIIIDFSTNYNKFFYNCSYLNNIIATTNSAENTGLTKVDTNTVSWT